MVNVFPDPVCGLIRFDFRSKYLSISKNCRIEPVKETIHQFLDAVLVNDLLSGRSIEYKIISERFIRPDCNLKLFEFSRSPFETTILGVNRCWFSKAKARGTP